INIILKRQTDHTDVSLLGGQTYAGDGEILHGSVNTGWALGDGFVNLSAEYRDRGETNRAGPDSLRVNPPRITQRLGDSDATDAYLWLNSAVPLGTGELYAFGGLSQREGNSSGFFRGPDDNRTVPELYPDGFLPTILTTDDDASLAVGYKAPLGNSNWDMDVSLNHGRSEFGFSEGNSANVSWWYEPIDPANPAAGIHGESPTSADTGTLRFDQTTFNLDFTGSVEGIDDRLLYLATGVEWRQDNYAIEAGDFVSYSYGRGNDRDIVIPGQAGDIAQPGMQGFPGFSPDEAVDEGRHSMAVYFDAETNLTERFLLGGAVRFEDYSDFG